MLLHSCALDDPLLQSDTQHLGHRKVLTRPSFLMGLGVAVLLSQLACTYGMNYLRVQMPIISMAFAPSVAASLRQPGPSITHRRSPSEGQAHAAQHGGASLRKVVALIRGIRSSAEPKEVVFDAEAALFGAKKKDGRKEKETSFDSEASSSLPSSAKENKDKGGLFGGLSGAVEYFVNGGRRRERWTKDFRPESERGKAAGPGPQSQLSWGGAESVEMYEEMAEQFQRDLKLGAASRLESQPLGSAATAIFGEAAKAGSKLDAEVYDESRLAEAPMDEEFNIEGSVELAELIRGKYGRYYDIDVKKSRDKLNEGKVILYVYNAFLGRRNFPYTEEQWLQKLNNIVILLTDLNQAWYIKKFLVSKREGSATILGARLSIPTNDKALTYRLNDSPTWEDPRDTDIFDSWVLMQSLSNRLR